MLGVGERLSSLLQATGLSGAKIRVLSLPRLL